MEQASNDGGGAEGLKMGPESICPEWVIPQQCACVWVQAPTAEAAVEIAVTRLDRARRWHMGRDVDVEVFAAAEYPNHARAGDYARALIIASQPS